MKSLTVDIPVQRFLKKYFYAQEKLPYGTPVDTTKGGHLPIVINLLFTGKIDTNFHEDELGDLDDHIPVILKYRRIDRLQLTINQERLNFFNAFLYKSFHDTLLTKVMAHYEMGAHGKNEANVIKDYMHELDIIDDTNFDTLKKASYRLRKSRNMPVFRDTNCPVA